MSFRKLFLWLLCTTSLCSSFAQSGTFSSVKMTGGGTSSNIRPRITLNNMNHPVITWNKTSNKIVSFSTWNGATFNPPVTLTPTGLQADVFTWAGQEIASIKDTVYIVYASLIGSESNVFIQKSIDGGVSFSDTLRVSNIGTDKARFPSVGINGNGQPAVTFMRMMSTWAMPHYAVANSMNGGASFMNDVDATSTLTGNEVCDCCPSAIVCDGNKQVVLFRDNAVNERDIKMVMSFNDGMSFDSIRKVDFNNWVLSACPSTGPDGHFGKDSLYTVFSSGATSPMKVFISAMHKSTLDVGTYKVISASTKLQQFPRIAGNEDTIGVVWQEYNKVMFAYSTNGVAGLSNPLIVNDSTDVSSNPDIAYANQIFHITWQSNSGHVHYRTFNMNSASSIENFEMDEITVSPNPSSSEWIVILKPQNEISTMELYDAFGRILCSERIPAHTARPYSIPNYHLQGGNYFFKIQSGKKYSVSKLVKI